MKNKLLFLLLGALMVFAFVLRVYKVGTLPLGAHPDEASWGYNAYSILETGKDEHGVKYPLVFKAFGDQKLPVLTYAIVPFVKLFGLNNLAVRFPAVIVGTLSVLVIFFLLREFKFTKEESLLGALISATVPWAIIMSRVFSPDSTTALFFYLCGLLALFAADRKKTVWLYIFSGLFFATTWYSYIAYRVVTPLTLGSYALIFWLGKKDFLRKSGMLVVTFILAVSPLLLLSFKGVGTARFSQVLSTPMQGMILEINENRFFCTEKLPRILCNINDNKLKAYSQAVLYRYAKVFSPEYLFLEGDKDSKFWNVKNYGQFYYFLLPFYLVGIVYFGSRLLSKKISREELFVLSGFITTPLAALLVNEPQKTRLSGLFPYLVIFLMFGLVYITRMLKKPFWQKLSLSTVSILLILFTGFFYIDFLVIHVHKNEFFYQNHVAKLMRYLGTAPKKTQIYIRSVDEGIVMYAYENKVDPRVYQQKVKRQETDAVGFAHAKDLENIHITTKSIGEIYCETKQLKQPIWYVTNEDFLSDFQVKKAEKIIYSETKVHKLEFVYNLKDLETTKIECP